MLDLLMKIGMPATVAAIIASLITFIPLVFSVNNRYAKAEEFKAQVALLQQENVVLRTELSRLNGFQQAMITIIQGNQPAKSASLGQHDLGRIVTVGFKSAQFAKPAASASSQPEKQRKPDFADVLKGLIEQQERLKQK